MNLLNNKKDIAILSAAILGFYLISQVFYGYLTLPDDVYIYLKYVRNLISFDEISFNKGIKTYGFTSPLWLFLIYASSFVSNNLYSIPQYLSLLCAFLSIVIWYMILDKMCVDYMKYLLLLMIIFEPNLLKHSNIGFESTMCFFLSSWLIYILFYTKKDNLYLLGIVLGLYPLVRPDSLIFLLPIVSSVLIKKKVPFKAQIFLLTLICIINFPWLIFSYLYFGTIFTSTFYVKGNGTAFGSKYIENSVDVAKIFFGNYMVPILATIIILVKSRTEKFNNYIKFVTAISISCLFYIISINNEIIYARYFMTVFPFLMYIFCLVLLSLGNGRRFNYVISLTLTNFIVILLTTNLFGANVYKHNEDVETQICNWINVNTSGSDKVVRERIGKVGFYCDRVVIDPIGIINKDIVEFQKNNEVEKYYMKYKPNIFIGDYDTIFQKNSIKYKVEKKFLTQHSSILRTQFLHENILDTIKVYRVDW